MIRYHLTYKYSRDGQQFESAQVLELSNHLEYDSDLQAVTQHLASQHDADQVMLLTWRKLKGALRPAEKAVPASAPSAPSEDPRLIEARQLALNVAAGVANPEALISQLMPLYEGLAKGHTRNLFIITGMLAALHATGAIGEGNYALAVQHVQDFSGVHHLPKTA